MINSKVSLKFIIYIYFSHGNNRTELVSDMQVSFWVLVFILNYVRRNNKLLEVFTNFSTIVTIYFQVGNIVFNVGNSLDIIYNLLYNTLICNNCKLCFLLDLMQ